MYLIHKKNKNNIYIHNANEINNYLLFLLRSALGRIEKEINYQRNITFKLQIYQQQ